MIEAIEAVGRHADSLAADTERLRRLPDELAKGLVETGIARALVPARYGGGEHHLLEVVDALERLAYHDGATAWCAMIAATTGLTAAFLPPEFAEEIYGDAASVTGGYAMPAGTGTATSGGIRVTGRWSWGSGTHHCTWIGGGVRVDDPAIGTPFVFFERAQVELLDDWDVVGLRGSGSGDYVVTDAFVPEGRWVRLGRDAPVVDSPLYRLPFLGVLAVGVSSVALGLARRGVAELVALAGDKRPAQSSRTLAERAVVQSQVAQAEAARRAALAFLREAVEAAYEDPTSPEQVRDLRLAATNAAWRSAGAVDAAYHAAGGSSIHASHPLQRVFRDVHVATQHGMVAERTYEPLGRLMLGLPTDLSNL